MTMQKVFFSLYPQLAMVVLHQPHTIKRTESQNVTHATFLSNGRQISFIEHSFTLLLVIMPLGKPTENPREAYNSLSHVNGGWRQSTCFLKEQSRLLNYWEYKFNIIQVLFPLTFSWGQLISLGGDVWNGKRGELIMMMQQLWTNPFKLFPKEKLFCQCHVFQGLRNNLKHMI